MVPVPDLPDLPDLPPAARPGDALAAIDTPALLLDLDAFERNLDAMQAAATAAGVALHGRVAAQPKVAAYLRSPRRIPFNEQGIFRHHPELDIAEP